MYPARQDGPLTRADLANMTESGWGDNEIQGGNGQQPYTVSSDRIIAWTDHGGRPNSATELTRGSPVRVFQSSAYYGPKALTKTRWRRRWLVMQPSSDISRPSIV